MKKENVIRLELLSAIENQNVVDEDVPFPAVLNKTQNDTDKKTIGIGFGSFSCLRDSTEGFMKDLEVE
jgi:hypothetical protein